jgi:hypothetical protein
MELLAPDIVVEVKTLSAGLCAGGLAVGLALWLFGWWSHRFWVVLTITLLAGVYGLYEASAWHVQPLVSAILLALAAGMLALALTRLLAFAAGGFTAVLGLQALVPTLDQPVICFLAGGLLGVVLFRFWIMALTSAAGTLLLGYCALGLAEHLFPWDAVAFSERQVVLLNWLCGVTALVGLVAQFWLTRGAGVRGKSGGKGKGKGIPFAELVRGSWLPRVFGKAA